LPALPTLFAVYCWPPVQDVPGVQALDVPPVPGLPPLPAPPLPVLPPVPD
jgi:hypothetical protein